MKETLRVTNDRSGFVTLWLEPWGEDYGIMPGDEFEIVVGDAADGFHFHIIPDDKGTKVYAEGQVTHISVFQSGAELTCGHNRRKETW
jgi:hypothetical protein